MSLLRGCEVGTTEGANIKMKAGSCLVDNRIASFDDRDNDDPSDDVVLKQCVSGYVANKDQVFINGLPVPFDQCCKCKPGKLCEFCKIPTNCTDEEKKKFVTQQACFGTESDDPPPPETNNECPKPKKCWTDDVWLTEWWHGLIVLFVTLILGFIIGKML